MAESKEYRKIKKKYGEQFAKLCRDLFPQILEEEGKLLEILGEKFDNNCNSFLGQDIIENNLIEDFKNYIFKQYEKKEEEKIDTFRTPYEILDEAGYNLYECKTEEDIQNFRKYYASDEVLCTIYNGGRLNRCYCFWAVKKDVDEIKRNDFNNPNKSDDYSTSVLAIQFDKKTGRPEIISRYNHSVSNPNCTLGNDLNNLALGLEQSFTNLLEERGLKINSENKASFEMPGYTVANDGKYYSYNMEINWVYYCPNNIVIEYGEPRTIVEKGKGILADYFCIDIQNKTITACNGIKDSFVQDLQDIEKMEITKSDREDEEEIIKIFKQKVEEPIIIGIDKHSKIKRYENVNVRKIGDYFLCRNKGLTMLNLPNLEKVGNSFLFFNRDLTTLDLQNLEQVGDDFLYFNKSLKTLKLPNLEQIGNEFLYRNLSLASLESPKLKRVGDGFLYYNAGLGSLELPELEQVGDDFLYFNKILETLKLPNLEQVGDGFLYCNLNLASLESPKLKRVGDGFLYYNADLGSLELPKLEQVGDDFIYCNTYFNTYFAELVLSNLEKEQKQLQETLKKTEELESQIDTQIQKKDKNGTEDKGEGEK